MKKILLVSCAASSLLLANSALNNIDLRDYKVVEGTYSKAYLDGRLTVEGGNQEQTNYEASVGANGDSVYTTAPYTWSIHGDARADFKRGDKDSDKTQKSYNFNAGTTFDKYFFNDDTFFGYGSAGFGYRKLSTKDNADDPYFVVGAGVGYGRMYDATALATSLRILEDLVKYNIVKSDVSNETAFALAKVVDVEDEYEVKYGSSSYKSYWYDAMEKVLLQNSALTKDALGAFGVARITEVLDTGVASRKHGWKVRAGFGKIISNYDGKSEDTVVELGFDYGLPLGLDTQITEYANLVTVLNNSDEQFKFSNKLTHTYELSDRIDWENEWRFNYTKYDEADNVYLNALSSTFKYDLANQLTYKLTLSAAKATGMKDWDTKLYTGITYRLK